MNHPTRLAVVVSHPIQYYSPWFRHLASRSELELKVFYLWDFGIKETNDEKFGTSFVWDIPLLDGYDHQLFENKSSDPGTHHFKGLDNPGAEGALLEWSPDAILLFGYNYATHLRLILSRRLRRIPMFIRGDSHNLFPVTGWKQSLSRFLRKLLFKRFQGVLSVGQANEEYYAQCGVPRSKMTRAYHCVDNERFRNAKPEAEKLAVSWKTELGIPDDHFVFLFAGKFESKKRPLDLLEAFQKLKLPKTSLLLIGGGEHEAALHEKAGDNVYFAPFQNQSQMPKVYASGDVVVLPSFGRGETWGLAVNEAMNLARPAIVSSHVGCGPDLVIEDKTGWIFEAGNIEALAGAMRKASERRDELKSIGQAAQDRVSEFSYEAAGDALLKALSQ